MKEVTVPALFAMFAKKFFLSFLPGTVKTSSWSFTSVFSHCCQHWTKEAFYPFAIVLQAILPYYIIIFTARSSAKERLDNH